MVNKVSIPSQRRYVGYWSNVLSFPRGVGNGPPIVNLPLPCSRELRRIRLYDTVNVDSMFFVVSELQEVCISVPICFCLLDLGSLEYPYIQNFLVSPSDSSKTKNLFVNNSTIMFLDTWSAVPSTSRSFKELLQKNKERISKN